MRPGDSVVTTASEFPANLTPWLALERNGVEVTAARDARRRLHGRRSWRPPATPRTRLVSLSLVSFHTGFRAPVEAIGAFCRDARHRLRPRRDPGASGAIPVDVAGWGVDFLSADGHKWMLGPEGCGILFTRPAFRERLRAPAGWTNLKRNGGGDFRVAGPRPSTPPTPRSSRSARSRRRASTRSAASLELLLLDIGLDLIGRRIARTLAVLVDGLPKLGFSPVLFDGPPRAGILAARPPAGKDARFFAKRLADADDRRRPRAEGFLRLSPHVGNDEEEAARVLAALGKA